MMDSVSRQAKLEVGRAVAYAYGLRVAVLPPACEDCGGDGCYSCFWTGDPQEIRRP